MVSRFNLIRLFRLLSFKYHGSKNKLLPLTLSRNQMTPILHVHKGSWFFFAGYHILSPSFLSRVRLYGFFISHQDEKKTPHKIFDLQLFAEM